MCDEKDALVSALEDALAAQKKRLDAALDALEGIVLQNCQIPESGRLDSCALSCHADAMLTLADEGLLVIEQPVTGRRVIGHWPKKEEGPCTPQTATDKESLSVEEGE